MPRPADRDAQRSVIAAAVARLVARHGLEAVSLRSAAAEAGVSMGRVQHYFATKDDLLLEALKRSYQGMEDRIQDRLEQLASRRPAGRVDQRELLVAVLEELLGENPETRDAIRINTAFAVRAHQDPRIAAVLTDGDDEIRALATAVVAEAAADGRVGTGVDPETAGRGLLALAAGLGGEVALHGTSPEVARHVLHHHLDLLLPPRPTLR